jgi:hypothetical protein
MENPRNIVPTDKSSVFKGLEQMTAMERNAIIRPDNPPPGVAGFVMDVRLEDTVRLESDITDHFVEDNTAVQDQIALKPEEVTVHGLVGELVQTQAQVDNAAQTLIDALPSNDDLAPGYTEAQAAALAADDAQAALVTAADTSVGSLKGYFTDRTPLNPTNQAQAFAYFYQLWLGRQMFTVDSPWGFFTNMAIKSCTAVQDATTGFVSDFLIVFKKIRFAASVSISPGQLAGRTAFQMAAQTNNGQAGKEPVDSTQNQSWLEQLTSP